MHGSPWCQKLSTAFGYFSSTSMKLYIGLNVKIIIDILHFYFYFITKVKFTLKLVWPQSIPKLFQMFNFSLMNWKIFLNVKVTQSYLTLCDPIDCIVHGILQARILKWVAFPFSRGSFQPRDWTQVSHIAGGFFTAEPQRKPQKEKRS